MPVANKYSVSEIAESARKYFEKTHRRVIFEYTLIDGNNDSYGDALRLASVVRNMSAHVNLIRLNPVKERHLRATSDAMPKNSCPIWKRRECRQHCADRWELTLTALAVS